MKCGGCGRALRTPESIARGLGPTCWSRLAPEQRAAAEPPAPAAPRAEVRPVACPDQIELPLTVPEPLPIDHPARADLPRPVRTQPITTIPTGDLL